MPKQKAIIVDIDGTISHKNGRDWYEYEKAINDTPDEAVLSVVKSLHKSGYKVIVVTCRSKECRKVTVAWLHQHLPEAEFLIMRDQADFRHDAQVKQEMYEKNIAPHYDVMCVFDDIDRVVSMWREIGLKCFQVQEEMQIQ